MAGGYKRHRPRNGQKTGRKKMAMEKSETNMGIFLHPGSVPLQGEPFVRAEDRKPLS